MTFNLFIVQPEKDAHFKSIIFQYENFSWIKYNTLFQLKSNKVQYIVSIKID